MHMMNKTMRKLGGDGVSAWKKRSDDIFHSMIKNETYNIRLIKQKNI